MCYRVEEVWGNASFMFCVYFCSYFASHCGHERKWFFKKYSKMICFQNNLRFYVPGKKSGLKMHFSLSYTNDLKYYESERESCSVVSNSLWPHGLYRPWNSPGQNTGMGILSLLRGIFPTQGSNLGLRHCRRILYQLSHKGGPRAL